MILNWFHIRTKRAYFKFLFLSLSSCPIDHILIEDSPSPSKLPANSLILLNPVVPHLSPRSKGRSILTRELFLSAVVRDGQEIGPAGVRAERGSAKTTDTPAEYRGRRVTESPRRARAICSATTGNLVDFAPCHYNQRGPRRTQRERLRRVLRRGRVQYRFETLSFALNKITIRDGERGSGTVDQLQELRVGIRKKRRRRRETWRRRRDEEMMRDEILRWSKDEDRKLICGQLDRIFLEWFDLDMEIGVQRIGKKKERREGRRIVESKT